MKAPRSSTDSGIFSPLHPLEYEVLRRIQSHPELRIASLVIRRVPQGVCLQGVIESDPEHVNFQQLLSKIEGVEHVINQLVPCREHHVRRGPTAPR